MGHDLHKLLFLDSERYILDNDCCRDEFVIGVPCVLFLAQL